MQTRSYESIDDIKIYDKNISEEKEDYNAKGLDKLFAQEEKHFWFISRKEFILQNIKNYVQKNKKIIEIGAGTGNVARYLMKNGYRDVSVGEMHLSGLKYAKDYGIKECYQFNLLDTPFEDEFDGVCMFDVLEHIQDDASALQNIYKSLKRDGKIVLTVPSHMWLWSRGDAIAGHKIRYKKKNLIEKLQKNGFEVLNAKYFFISITPLLYLRAILNKDDSSDVKDEEHNMDISMNSFISNILLFISRVENKINKYLPNFFGGSLFIVARKK